MDRLTIFSYSLLSPIAPIAEFSLKVHKLHVKLSHRAKCIFFPARCKRVKQLSIVEKPLLKPICSQPRILLVLIHSINLWYRRGDYNFSTDDRRLIGRWLAGSSLLPFLKREKKKIEMITERFQTWGITPVWFITEKTGARVLSQHKGFSLRSSVGTLSRPGALPDLI